MTDKFPSDLRVGSVEGDGLEGKNGEGAEEDGGSEPGAAEGVGPEGSAFPSIDPALAAAAVAAEEAPVSRSAPSNCSTMKREISIHWF